MVGVRVSILMQGIIDPTTNAEIGNDTYNVSFVSHSRLLQSHYSATEVCSIQLLFIKLNDAITQEKLITDDEQTMEEPILTKYDNVYSNAPVICPVISTLLIHYLMMTASKMMKKKMATFHALYIVVGINTLTMIVAIGMLQKSVNFQIIIKIVQIHIIITMLDSTHNFIRDIIYSY